MTVIIKKTGQINNIQKLKSHIKYIGFRSQEIEKGGETFQLEKGHFFSKYADNSNYKTFINSIEKNKALKYGKSVKAHKFIFSLTEKDYQAYLKSGKDYKDLVRKTLESYERKKGVKLNWIATEHLVDGKGKSHHPHCHVVIQGVSEPDKEGKVKRIKFYKEDFKELREEFDKELRREIGTREKDFNIKEYYNNKLSKDIGKGFELVGKQIQKDIKKNEREIQREHYLEQQRRKNREERER